MSITFVPLVMEPCATATEYAITQTEILLSHKLALATRCTLGNFVKFLFVINLKIVLHVVLILSVVGAVQLEHVLLEPFLALLLVLEEYVTERTATITVVKL